MPIELESKVQGERNAAQARVDAANKQFEKLKADYEASPERQLERDREYLTKLQNDPDYQGRKLASPSLAREEQMFKARLERAEQTEAAHLEALARGEVTVGDEITRRDMESAVGDILATGVRAELVETFLKTGRSGGPNDRATEIAAANEWYRQLMASPERQQLLLNRDPQLMKDAAAGLRLERGGD
jgi:hypothetical protein